MSSYAIFQSKRVAQSRKTNRFALSSIVILVLLGLALFLVAPSKASRKIEKGFRKATQSVGSRSNSVTRSPEATSRLLLSPALLPAFLSPSPSDPDLVETFKADCTTPLSAFNLGDTVCVKVSGGPPLSLYPRKIAWVDNFNNIQQRVDITTDPQTDLFTLPNAGSIDYRGVWRVNSISAARSSVRASAFFTVSDPALPAADLSIYNGNDTDGSITAGSNLEHVLWFSNKGPDAATDVQVTDVTPANTTFLSGVINDTSWNCTFPDANSAGGTSTCTLASLAPGASAKITLVYNVNSGTAAGTVIADTANISSTTPDPHDASNTPPPDDPNADPSNNTATSRTVVLAGATGATCTLQCPDNVNAIADTTEGGQRGAHVTFDDATTTGTCGTVTATPASGSFFPVGTTAVNVSSSEGDGSCSFTVTVQDTGTNPPTITCPPNKTADANGDCEAIVVLGTPTTSGDNVTVVGTRSDGKPMYDCDINNNCTRKSSDLPFSAGVTTITWIATSHDAQGNDTGNASCQQTVTVNDTTPPVITAVDQTVSADANCQAAVPDYSNQVTDNCACAANDTSQDCVGQHRISTTQDVPAGTLLGPGSYTIHLTANDGSSNNGGAGNTTTKDVVFTVKDTTAPTINCPANITANTDPGTCSATVNPGTATATDNCDINPTVVGTRSDNQPLNAAYPKGTTTITWTATDHASPANQSSCQQTVTVSDHEPPTISCPSSFTLEPTCPSGAVGNYTTPVGSDNCAGAVTNLTAGLASGSVFPIGTTTVTYTVTDASGNSTSCSFTVTVLTPQAVLQNLINSVNASSLTGTQKNGLLAKLNAALSAVNSGQTSVACNKLSEFVNNVGNLISQGSITAAQGNAWISSANHVRNTIGCTNNPCT
jgi:uncharacterized repeat protein (TIGR01451 family)